MGNIQQFLLGKGFEDIGQYGQPDGQFGPKTGEALDTTLKLFQKSAGLEASGEYTPETRQVLIDRAASIQDPATRDSLNGFVKGLDDMQNTDIQGQSALDRVYNPKDYEDSHCSLVVGDNAYSLDDVDISSDNVQPGAEPTMFKP